MDQSHFPAEQPSTSSATSRRSVRFGTLLQRRLTSIRTPKNSNPPTIASTSSTSLSEHSGAPSLGALRRRTSAPTALSASQQSPPSSSLSKRPSTPFRLRKDSSPPDSLPAADDFKVRRATTLVATLPLSSVTTKNLAAQLPPTSRAMRTRAKGRFKKSSPSISPSASFIHINQSEDLKLLSDQNDQHQHFPNLANTNTHHQINNLVLQSSHVDTTTSTTTNPESLAELTFVPQAVNHTSVAPSEWNPPPSDENLQSVSVSNRSISPPSVASQIEPSHSVEDTNYASSTSHDRQIASDQSTHGDQTSSTTLERLDNNGQPSSDSDHTSIDFSNSESRVKQLSALFNRADQTSSRSSQVGQGSSTSDPKDSTALHRNQNGRDPNTDSDSPQRPRSGKILDLVALFEKDGAHDKDNAQARKEGHNTDQPEESSARNSDLKDKANVSSTQTAAKTISTPKPVHSPEKQLSDENPQNEPSPDPARKVEMKKPRSNASTSSSLQKDNLVNKEGGSEVNEPPVVDTDDEQQMGATEQRTQNIVDAYAQRRDNMQEHESEGPTLDETIVKPPQLETSLNSTRLPRIQPTDADTEPQVSSNLGPQPIPSKNHDQTQKLHQHQPRHEPPSPPNKAELFRPDTAVIEADSAALGLSRTERYRTMNLRAERVANALERIGKRVEQFTESRDDDGLAPREAIIPLMIESMQHHRNDCKVADRALSTLRRLTVSDTCRARIGECGGIEAVVDIMKCHSLLVRIQTQACLTLANLTYENEANKEEVVRCGGLQAVVAALSQHKAEENVQAWGCLAIRNFTNYSGPRTQDASLAAEAVSVLLCALEEYPQTFMVQQNGLIALVNIASCSSYGLERIRDEGGVLTLIECMRSNIRSEKLSEVALCLSRVLVEDKRVQKLFGQHKGIEVVTSVMDEYETHVGIAVKGCATFRNLAFQRENRHLLGKSGSIRTIVSALSLPFTLDESIADVDAVSYFLKALSNVTYDSIANKTLAGRLGAVDATLKLLTAHRFRDDERVVVDACRALRNLVDGVSQNHRLVLRNKGVVAVLDALRLHGLHSSGVAEHGIAIFVNMSCNRAFANQILEGSGEVLKIAQQMENAHAGNDLVHKQASSLLRYVNVNLNASTGNTTIASQAAATKNHNTHTTANNRSIRVRPTRQNSSTRRDGRNNNSYKNSIKNNNNPNNRSANTNHHPAENAPTGTDRMVRASKSHHRNEEEQQMRLQRLRSLPLPLSRHRADPTSSRHAS